MISIFLIILVFYSVNIGSFLFSHLDLKRTVTYLHDGLLFDASNGKYYISTEKNSDSDGSSNSNRPSRSTRSSKNGNSASLRERNIDKVLKTGEIFLQKKSTSRRQLPWWMKDSERNHPRILPAYRPWWLNPQNPIVNPSWTVPELRAEATRRGAHCSHWNKQQLLDWLLESSTDYNLSETNFKGPTFSAQVNTTDSCYPEVYGVDPSNV